MADVLADGHFESIDVLEVDIEEAGGERFSDRESWIHLVNSLIVQATATTLSKTCSTTAAAVA